MIGLEFWLDRSNRLTKQELLSGKKHVLETLENIAHFLSMN